MCPYILHWHHFVTNILRFYSFACYLSIINCIIFLYTSLLFSISLKLRKRRSARLPTRSPLRRTAHKSASYSFPINKQFKSCFLVSAFLLILAFCTVKLAIAYDHHDVGEVPLCHCIFCGESQSSSSYDFTPLAAPLQVLIPVCFFVAPLLSCPPFPPLFISSTSSFAGPRYLQQEKMVPYCHDAPRHNSDYYYCR